MAEQEDYYDEFGNYIGPDLDSDDDDDDDDDDEVDEDDDQDEREREGNHLPDESRYDALDDHEHDDDPMGGAASGGAAPSALTSLIPASSSNNATMTTAPGLSMVVYHEDKEYYPSAEQVFGEEVRTAVLDEDAMDLETPIMAPLHTKSPYVPDVAFAGQQRPGEGAATNHVPSTTTTLAGKDSSSSAEWTYRYTDEYLGMQLSNETTRTRRGVAIVGHLHHGKTCLVDLLLESTLLQEAVKSPNSTASKQGAASWGIQASLDVPAGGGPRFTDTLITERLRQMSLVSTPVTTLLADTRGKSYALTLIDCPGHVHFHDESVAALRAVDGVVLVVDAAEGLMMHTEMVVRQAITEGLPLTVVMTKVDRLIVELKLPPRDCYYQLAHTLDELNVLIDQASQGRYPPLSPARGNVAFSSAQHGWLFTLESFAAVYLEQQQHQQQEQQPLSSSHASGLGDNLSVSEFAKRLWGDSYLDPQTRTFHKSSRDCSVPQVERTFVVLVLEPLYKIYSACLAEAEPDVNRLLRSVGVLLSREELRSSARTLLRAALSKFLQSARGGFVDMVVQHVAHPAAAAPGKVARCYTGPLDSKVAQSMMACDPRGPLIIHAMKNYPALDGQSFMTLGRIYSGTVRPGDAVQVMGESYSPDGDDEDVAGATIEAVLIPRGRNHTPVTMAKAGNWVLLQGVDAHMTKTATLVGQSAWTSLPHHRDLYIFAPLKFPHAGGESVMKLAIEPLLPAELPKMVEGLRRISKAYPMAKTKVEESGEHVLLGTGELYLDCVMHDLRHVYSDIEVKVADPIVSFRETVVETSSVKCFADTANKRNKLTMIAEPLDDGLAERLEAGKVNPAWDKKKLGRFFQSQYNWDLLSSRSVWAFGDSPTHGTNLLMDDTLPSEVDKSLLLSCKSSIVQGFQWATREGPLCEELVRSTKVKILDAVLADKPIHRGGGQIIPTARRTVHSALLTATPRLMEPVYRLQIQCPGALVDSIQPLLARRRGHIVQDRPMAGTTLFTVKAFVPVLDSFGFETDLRTVTQGQAMVYSVFDHWSVVPGDPLDRSILLHPLEPSPPQHLARELLIKTRRRKGLSEDVSMSKFFDEGMKINSNFATSGVLSSKLQ